MKKMTSKFIAFLMLCGILILGMVVNITLPKQEFSYSERRKLSEFPQVKIQKIANGDFFDDLEDYFLDHFVYRDFFRRIDSLIRLNIFNQKDINGIYSINGGLYKIEYPLNEESVIALSQKIEDISQKYLKGMQLYYSVIPDKSYFVSEENGYLCLDYQEMLSILDENISLSEYIDIFSCLNVDDYYLTDIHWRQDKLVKVANQIFDGMNDSYRIILEDYEIHKLSPFYGAYYGQFPLKARPDELVYLTNETTEKALVYNYYTSSYTKVYDEEKIDSADGYSVYLEGPVPLITIENPLCDNDDELYIFRDSFGSSLAPLLIERYKKIYLIDLRYASEDLIAENIDYKEGQRVLFLYSTTIINNSSTLL